MRHGTSLITGILLLAASLARCQESELKIENESLTVTWLKGTGRISLATRGSGKVFLGDTMLSRTGGTAKITAVVHEKFGPGHAIEVAHPDGNLDTVTVFQGLPFALFRARLHNGATNPVVTQKFQALSALTKLGKPAAVLKTFGTGGLLAPDQNPGSYAWLAVAEPQSRNGVVFGWLTQDRGSGVLLSKVVDDSVRVEAQIEYGRLRIPPGKTEDLETLAVGYFDDARLGLERWADAVAKVYDIHLPPQPAGYCTWYSPRPYNGAGDETNIVKLAAFAAKELAPFGFSVVQIDDHWQAGVSTNGPKRNFTTHAAKGPYPSGMKATADKIKALGLRPGIWFMPFAGTYYDPFFADHQDWFVKRANGEPYETSWGGACLDMTHPGARAHLRDVAGRICREWGFQYIKVDGLWTGTATRQQYVNSSYKDDNMGDAVLSNPDKTNIEAYRDGLKLLREAAGRQVFILGCNGPQNMRSYGGAFGLVDAMRVGPDNGSDWARLQRGPLFGTRHYFLHGRVWYNDPDPVYVRASIPLNRAQLICSWAALSGQLNLDSEWLPDLPPERLDILKRTMPAHGLRPRPADLFDKDLPSLWLLSAPPSPEGSGAAGNRRTPRRDVIGVFNWDRTEQSFDYPLERVGLDATVDYVAFDYWANALVPSVKGRLQITVPAESCRVLAVRPRADYPQLLSTSRHVTQGIVDVIEERWDAATGTLHGSSKLVGGDSYELRIIGGANASAIEVTLADAAAGVKGSLTQNGQLLRAKLESPTSREVAWTVRFGR